MTHGPARRGPLVLARRGALGTLLLARAAGGGRGREDAEGAAAPAAGLALGDVQAPEVFQVTEEGLWDGRPSLGGVWVAHPDVADPERVLIRNEATGATVVGALFRRERDVPGPALQVSSDAAEALAMLAGAPEVLSVTALRREAAAPPDEPERVEGLAEAQALAVEPVAASALPPADEESP